MAMSALGMAAGRRATSQLLCGGRSVVGAAQSVALARPRVALAGRLAGGQQTIKTKTNKLRSALDVSAAAAVPSKPVLGLSAGLGSVLGLMQANPFAAQVTIATAKTSLADILVQKRVEGRENVDWRRNALFIAFGGAYLGVFQWFVYVRLFQRMFPAMNEFCAQPLRQKLKNKAGIKALFQQIGLDFVFVQPFVYFPVFYCFKTLLDPEAQTITQRLGAAFDNLKKNFWQDNLGMMGFWLPMDIIIYSAPIYLRLPLNHCISFAWCLILSIFRGGDEEEAEGVKNTEGVPALTASA